MILLEDGTDRIAVFGVGLVGSALVESLLSRPGMRSASLSFPWRAPEDRDRALRTIASRIEADAGSSREGRRTIVWSAGRAGFGASREEAAEELSSVQSVLSLAQRVEEERRGRTRVVVFSSAGGLFEGQRRVDGRSAPAPRRPYGELKLEQESLVRRSGLPAMIVRLSTVYGHARPGQRAGLVTTLLWNGIRREVSSIFGSMNTLRDFVWAGDVAAFVSDRMARDFDSVSTDLLASGRPTSIFEIQKIIEDLLGYKIFVSHAPRASNSEDITFAATALPEAWFPSDLRTNVGVVYRVAIRRGDASLRGARRVS